MSKLKNILADEGLTKSAGDGPKGRLKIEGAPYRGRTTQLKGTSAKDYMKIWKLINDHPFWQKHGWDDPPDLYSHQAEVESLKAQLKESQAELDEIEKMVSELSKVGIDYSSLGFGYDLVATDEEGNQWAFRDGIWEAF